MVVAVFPLVKIGLLLLKQLSKPMANIIKNEVKKHPQVRKYVVVPIGKAYNWAENTTVRGLKGNKSSQAAELSEEEAVELGANAVGEIILFGILCLILLAEMNRQGEKKLVIEKIKAEELGNLQDMVLQLHSEVDNLKKSVDEIKTSIEHPMDIFDLEAHRHTQIDDDNFWDVLSTYEPKSEKKSKRW